MLEISQISCRLSDGGDERSCIEACTREALGILRCRRADIERIELRRKSIDARKKSNVHFTLSALVHLASEVDEADLLSRLSDRDRKRVRAVDADDPSFPAPVQDGLCEHRPVVVGAGCAGLFAALTLAEAGLRPILLERGDDATRRTEAVEHFNATGVLDTESNIQFGLGGARHLLRRQAQYRDEKPLASTGPQDARRSRRPARHPLGRQAPYWGRTSCPTSSRI